MGSVSSGWPAWTAVQLWRTDTAPTVRLARQPKLSWVEPKPLSGNPVIRPRNSTHLAVPALQLVVTENTVSQKLRLTSCFVDCGFSMPAMSCRQPKWWPISCTGRA